MQKSKEWACSEGCDLSTGVICPHLEALLPHMNDGDHPRYVSGGAIASFTMNVHQAHFWKHDEAKFLTLMRNYGFTDQWDLDLLGAKYFRNLSVRDIEKEFNWTSKSAVSRRLRELRALLVERGFEQELE